MPEQLRIGSPGCTRFDDLSRALPKLPSDSSGSRERIAALSTIDMSYEYSMSRAQGAHVAAAQPLTYYQSHRAHEAARHKLALVLVRRMTDCFLREAPPTPPFRAGAHCIRRLAENSPTFRYKHKYTRNIHFAECNMTYEEGKGKS